MMYKVFNNFAEIMTWAKGQFPGCSLSVEHLEGDRYVVIVKGKGKIQREVIYVKWNKEETATSQAGNP